VLEALKFSHWLESQKDAQNKLEFVSMPQPWVEKLVIGKTSTMKIHATQPKKVDKFQAKA